MEVIRTRAPRRGLAVLAFAGLVLLGLLFVPECDDCYFVYWTFDSLKDWLLTRPVTEGARIVGVPDPVTGTVAPLHWILQDRGGRCLTAEQTAAGLRLLENPVGVLSNSPDLPWHLTNLRNYAGLSPLPHPDARWEGAELSPFGQGSGGLGLPGDYTPPSRFVRAAFLKSHAPVPASRQEAVVTGFHLLESVTVPRGAVITDRGTQDYTQYTVFYSTVSGECWFKSYHNSQVLAARLSGGLAHGPGIRSLAVLNHPAPFQRVPAE